MQDSFDLVVFTDAPIVQRTGRPKYVPRLTPEEIATATALYHEGKNRQEICRHLGWKTHVWEDGRRPGGPLCHLPKRQGRRVDLQQDGARLCVDVATPAIAAEVEQRRAAVEASWSAEVRQARAGLPPEHWHEVGAKSYAPCPPRGAVSTRLPRR